MLGLNWTARSVAFVVALAVAALAAPVAARAGDAQELVDRARLAFEDIINHENFGLARSEIKKARGVLIIPQLFKAGFIVGGEGGSGVLLARAADGTWSQPAFYTMGAGSIGLQIGVKDSEVLLILRNGKAVDAVLDDQVKLGGDVSVAMGTVGAEMEASTTTNLGADILSYSLSRGAFGGGALEGAVIAKRNDLNEEYYGREVTPQEIVRGGAVSNAGADALRDALARW
jgi:lipid-binding SYLF domain-containing protein